MLQGASMQCLWCKAQLNEGATVCAKCGRDQQRRCTNCAERIAANLEKCPKCNSGKGFSPLAMIVIAVVVIGVLAGVVQALLSSQGKG